MKKYFFVLYMLASLNTFSQAFQWVQRGVIGEYTYGAINQDPFGNVYISGFFKTNAQFFKDNGTSPLFSLSSTPTSSFVAKYNSMGIIQNAKKMAGGIPGTSSTISNSAVYTDDNINSYQTGSFTGIVTFGSTGLTSAGGKDIFIAKYDSAGTLQWAVQAGGINDDEGKAIYADSSGNVYVTGYFQTNATFGSASLTGSGYEDIFTAKYNSAGILQWVQKAGGIYNEYGDRIIADQNGNIYVTGIFQGPTDFGSITLPGNGGNMIFMAKYNSSGTVQWAKQAGGTGADHINGISANSSGLYITGSFLGVSTFGNTSLTSSTTSAFIAKYNTSGGADWAEQGTNAAGNGIATDISGNIYATGSCDTTSVFYGTASDSMALKGNNFGMFIVKYSSSGILKGIKLSGGDGQNGSAYGQGISISNSGNMFVGGIFSGFAIFDNINMFSGTPYQPTGYFLSKVDPDKIVGINDLNTNLNDFTINIFPNPSDGVINLTTDFKKYFYVQVKNIFGQVVYSEQVMNNVGIHKINLNTFSKGTYFLNLISDQQLITKKIILQ